MRPQSEELNYGMSVDEYFSLDNKMEQEILHLTQTRSFVEVFAKVRPTFEQMFKNGNAQRPSSFAKLFQQHYQKRHFCFQE